MFKQLFEFIRQALLLQRDLRELREDVASLQREVEEANALAARLAFEIQRIGEREQQEREKFVLKVENALLRFERALPPARDSRKKS